MIEVQTKDSLVKKVDIILAEVHLLKMEVAFHQGEYLNNSITDHLFEMCQCNKKLEKLKQ